MSPLPDYRLLLVRELRKQPTTGEEKQWQQLRSGRLGGYKFRRQHPIGRYIADFCCISSRLIVETDGPIHNNDAQAEYDRIRDIELSRRGYQILRISQSEVMDHMPETLIKIKTMLETAR